MAESNPYTDSTIRCLKCVSFVLYEFPKIMQKIMEQSGLSSAWVFNRIQNDLEFDSKLTGPEKQTTQTLQSDGYKYLDVTLIYKIITHFKVFLPTPTRGWGLRPKPNETRIGDDVERLRLKRNQFMHKGTDVLSEVEFEAFFAELTSLCERVDRYVSCPDEESFMRKAKNYKIQPLRDPEEIRQEYNKERSLTEFFVSQTGKNRFKVYKTQSFKAFVQHILENQEHDGVNAVPITLTFDEIQSNSEFIRIMNELRDEINKNLVHIEVKKFQKGCLIMDITVTLFVLLSDDDFERELKLMLDYLSSCHFFGEVLSKVSTVTIVISENEDSRANAESIFEQSCYTPGSLQLDIQVSKEVLQTDGRLQTELQNVLSTVVSYSNGNQTFPSDEPVITIIEPGKIDDMTSACSPLGFEKDTDFLKKLETPDNCQEEYSRQLELDIDTSQAQVQIKKDSSGFVEFTNSNYRFMKCTFIVFGVFQQIISEIMNKSGVPALFAFECIQPNKRFNMKLDKTDHIVLQTMYTDGYSKLNITLMNKLMRHYSCMFVGPPTRGWNSNPMPSEITIGDDVQRLFLLQKRIVRRCNNEMSEMEYDNFCEEVSSICERVDKYLCCSGEDSFKTKLLKIMTRPLGRPAERYSSA